MAGKRRIRRKSLLNNGFRGGEGERYPQLERTGTECERKRERERERGMNREHQGKFKRAGGCDEDEAESEWVKNIYKRIPETWCEGWREEKETELWRRG